MAVTPWLELGAGAQLLVKQSETMAEPLWQGANAALRVQHRFDLYAKAESDDRY